MAVAGALLYAQILSNITQNTKTIERHIQDNNVHQPYKKKLESWYTRTEGVDNKKSLLLLEKRLNSIERKLDILINKE